MMQLNLDDRPKDLIIPLDLAKLIYSACMGDCISNQTEQNGDVYSTSLQGQVTIKFKNGNEYEGQTDKGRLQGKGKLQIAQGGVYTGDFQNSVIKGFGVYEWPDGSRYEGEVFNGLRHGKGIYKSPKEEAIYEGQWITGLRHGRGKLIFKNGSYYEGDFQNGFKHGKGKMVYPNNNYYEGDWKFDKKEGQGTMYWLTRNEKYYGEWRNNLQNGNGVQIWLEQKGEGKMLRNRYEGQWVDGKRQGYGVFYYANGSKYEGEFKENLKEGFAVITEETGNLIQGIFKADKLIKQEEKQVKIQQKLVKKKTNKVFQFKEEKTPKNNKKGKKEKPLSQADLEKIEQDKKELEKKLEIQANPFPQLVDFTDILEEFPDDRLKVMTNMQTTLLRLNSQIRQVYKVYYNKYENSLGEDAFCMDMKTFWKYLKENKLISSTITLASINRLYILGAKNRFDIKQRSEDLEKRIQIIKGLDRQVTNHEMNEIFLYDLFQKTSSIQLRDRFFDFSNKEPLSKGINTPSKPQQQISAINSPHSQQQNLKSPQSVSFNSNNSQNNYESINQVFPEQINIHDGRRVIFYRHFVELLVRLSFLRCSNINEMHITFQKIIENYGGQLTQSQVMLNTSHISEGDPDIVYMKYKKYEGIFENDISDIFNKLSNTYKDGRFGYIDKTLRFKDFYKMLQKTDYLRDQQDKVLILHIVEKNYDPETTLAHVDHIAKEKEKEREKREKEKEKDNKLNKQQQQKQKNQGKKGLSIYDKLKQIKIIQILQSELIFDEFAQIFITFLFRKDRDMAHSKNEEEVKKKMRIHIERFRNYINAFSNQAQIRKKPERIWPTTEKDIMKLQLEKNRLQREKQENEFTQKQEEINREQMEQILMQQEDINIPSGEDEFEELEESEIEQYDNTLFDGL